MPDLTDYEKRCREACPKGCGKGIPRVHKFIQGDFHRFEYIEGDSEDFSCTAPTRDAYEAELIQQLAEAKKDTERVEKVLRILNVSGSDGLSLSIFEAWINLHGETEYTRNHFDAAREGEKP